jgi:hypothetical protein
MHYKYLMILFCLKLFGLSDVTFEREVPFHGRRWHVRELSLLKEIKCQAYI